MGVKKGETPRTQRRVRQMQRMKFKDVQIGKEFEFNGITATKQSTRTAKIKGVGRVFYWGQNEVVKVAK
jgi:hypothetical protein